MLRREPTRIVLDNDDVAELEKLQQKHKKFSANLTLDSSRQGQSLFESADMQWTPTVNINSSNSASSGTSNSFAAQSLSKRK